VRVVRHSDGEQLVVLGGMFVDRRYLFGKELIVHISGYFPLLMPLEHIVELFAFRTEVFRLHEPEGGIKLPDLCFKILFFRKQGTEPDDVLPVKFFILDTLQHIRPSGGDGVVFSAGQPAPVDEPAGYLLPELRIRNAAQPGCVYVAISAFHVHLC